VARLEISPLEFNERVEVMYMAITGSKTPIGAYTWLSREFGIADRTVRRWSAGDTLPPAMVGILFDYIEQYDIGDRTMERAREQYALYKQRKAGGTK
jgi:hypothetical protein